MTDCFYLHRLPQKELSNVLLCMEFIDRLSYSLCSQKCKKRYMDLNLTATNLELIMNDMLCISIDFGNVSLVKVTTSVLETESTLNLNAPRTFEVKSCPILNMENDDEDEFLLDIENDDEDEFRLNIEIDDEDEFLLDIENDDEDEFLLDIGIDDEDEFLLDIENDDEDEFLLDIGIDDEDPPLLDPQVFLAPLDLENDDDILGNPLGELPDMENQENVVGIRHERRINLMELLGNGGDPPAEENLNQEQVMDFNFDAAPHEEPARGDENFGDIQRLSSSWNYSNFSAQDWFKHLLEIHNCESIDRISFGRSIFGFDIGQLAVMLEDLNIRNLDIDMPHERILTQRILNLHLPAKQISIDQDSFDSPETVRHLFIENLDHVTVGGSFFEDDILYRTVMTLDEILLTNISQLHIIDIRCSGKELNRLVKSWMRGACKRLEMLYLELKRVTTVATVLQGIAHTEMSGEDLHAKMVAYDYDREPYNVLSLAGGFNIRGKDGREATLVVLVDEDNIMSYFQIFVWK